MRKRFVGLLSFLILMNNVVFADTTFHGRAEFDERFQRQEEDLFTGKTETLDKKDVMLSAILIGNNVVNLSASSLTTIVP